MGKEIYSKIKYGGLPNKGWVSVSFAIYFTISKLSDIEWCTHTLCFYFLDHSQLAPH